MAHSRFKSGARPNGVMRLVKRFLLQVIDKSHDQTLWHVIASSDARTAIEVWANRECQDGALEFHFEKQGVAEGFTASGDWFDKESQHCVEQWAWSHETGEHGIVNAIPMN